MAGSGAPPKYRSNTCWNRSSVGAARRNRGHRGAEFAGVDIAEYLFCRTTFRVCHDPGALPQAWSEARMIQVGTGLIERGDGVLAGHGAEPEAGNLGKDEPHPMGGLPTPGQLLDYPFVAVSAVLSLDEPGEIEGIIHGGVTGSVANSPWRTSHAAWCSSLARAWVTLSQVVTPPDPAGKRPIRPPGSHTNGLVELRLDRLQANLAMKGSAVHDAEHSAASVVCSSNMAMVMGPTPPGTGVISAATPRASSKATSPVSPEL